jgi:alpha/beta superfamily hydrolase
LASSVRAPAAAQRLSQRRNSQNVLALWFPAVAVLIWQATPCRMLKAPTLLIVGGYDDVVIDLNEMARHQMRCEVKQEIVPGSTHLFEEPGALECVAEFASDWFSLHLARK